MKTPTKQRHMSLSSQPVSNNENVCRLYSPRPPHCLVLISDARKTVCSKSVLSPRPPGASSDRRGLNLCCPRRPEETDLDWLGSASLSRGLVPDPDFLVPGHLRWSEATRD